MDTDVIKCNHLPCRASLTDKAVVVCCRKHFIAFLINAFDAYVIDDV